MTINLLSQILQSNLYLLFKLSLERLEYLLSLSDQFVIVIYVKSFVCVILHCNLKNKVDRIVRVNFSCSLRKRKQCQYHILQCKPLVAVYDITVYTLACSYLSRSMSAASVHLLSQPRNDTNSLCYSVFLQACQNYIRAVCMLRYW